MENHSQDTIQTIYGRQPSVINEMKTEPERTVNINAGETLSLCLCAAPPAPVPAEDCQHKQRCLSIWLRYDPSKASFNPSRRVYDIAWRRTT